MTVLVFGGYKRQELRENFEFRERLSRSIIFRIFYFQDFLRTLQVIVKGIKSVFEKNYSRIKGKIKRKIKKIICKNPFSFI
jgi:hypothetical protein